VFPEDISGVSEQWQLPPEERVSPRSRAPSISSRSHHVRVRLPPPPPLDSLVSFARSWQALNAACVGERLLKSEASGVPSEPTITRVEGRTSRYNRFVYFVYMVRCADGTLYTGFARDPDERVRVHNSGKGAKYTRSRLPVSLVYVEECESLSAALKRERQLKPWSRTKKEALIAGDEQALKRA
jgi:putative endonuclease